jgi:hypothetical protein
MQLGILFGARLVECHAGFLIDLLEKYHLLGVQVDLLDHVVDGFVAKLFRAGASVIDVVTHNSDYDTAHKYHQKR